LSNSVKNELDRRDNLGLRVLAQQSLTIQIPLKLKQLCLGSDKPLALRKKSDWGIHHKITHLLRLVKERIKKLTPDLAMASCSTEITLYNEDEGMNIVTKFAELGIGPDRLEKHPFSIPKPLFYDAEQKILIVDWSKYVEIFKSQGIKYSDILNLKNHEELINWYENRFLT